MNNPKIAVVTTFPNEQFELCAAEMLATFNAYWPEDIKIYIQVDQQPEEQFKILNEKIISILGEERSFIASLWDDEQKAFLGRWKDYKPKNYLDDVVRFSHKVFAVEKCADALKDTVDYLIWLDADVITKRTITYDWLKEVLPGPDEVCSYLGREGWYSECGWVAYNLKAGGYDLLREMKLHYTADGFRDLANGWTDCHIFDNARKAIVATTLVTSKNLSPFYVKDVTDINVWKSSKLAEKMVHRKGNRKQIAHENRGKIVQQKPASNIVDSNEMRIKTRNCLDHKKICENVNKNVSQIRAWATLTNPTPQDIVICSAGPSLAEHIEEIREKQNKGAKIIAVKHAINTLKMHGIKPWAVVLLDPRAHVEGFVKDPDTDPVYFVASMCDPSVVKTLNDHKCKVVGYHALVNAGEQNEMIPVDLPFAGGSATATRSIALFADMFGYKNFHIYGLDLCHPQKPDMNEAGPDGKPKYMEINIGTNTFGNKYITRTFWTEGQFLAQSNEITNLLKERKDLKIEVHGDGLAGWLYKHHQALKKYQAEYNERLNEKRKGSPDLDGFITAVTRGHALAKSQ
jgi:hypothetical protein